MNLNEISDIGDLGGVLQPVPEYKSTSVPWRKVPFSPQLLDLRSGRTTQSLQNNFFDFGFPNHCFGL